MKMFKIPVALLLVVAPWLMLRGVEAADVSVSFAVSSVDDFYEPLSTEGYWVQVGSYGRCWRPSYVASYWRPYCDGTWVWTDDGWYWQSDESWAWATYHYGRWTLDPYYGWVWVPDTVWGPSWVVFREGGGYCGWAPLPPGAVFGPQGTIIIGAGEVPETWFVFIGDRHFGDRHSYHELIVHNRTIYDRTRMNTTIRREGGRVMTEGPRLQTLQPINRERIRESTVKEMRQSERVPPSFRRTAPQEMRVPQQNERQNQRAPAELPKHEQPHKNEPEIIRGTPNTPPAQGQQQHSEPSMQRRETPPEHQGYIEQAPNTPVQGRPSGERVAPAPQPKKGNAPAQERGREGRERGGDDSKDDRQR
ncbi:MAG TPA: DUF6600 domain-containing protein [Verrucomicrobiae bacterium]|nr:DUF6600 domain-containing protein [Verrucomicrobiae bacterium]